MLNYETFAREWLGRRVADPQLGAIGMPPEQWFQCVSLVKQYLREVFGVEAGFWGNAIDYWSATNPALYAKFDRIGSTEASKGDIVVLKTRGYTDYTEPGHIGIATGNSNASQVEILEQNGATGGGGGTGGDAIRTRLVDKSRIAGLLRPHNLAPELPYTITAVDPYKVDVLPGHQKWNLALPDFASVAANPVLTLNQQTTITVAAELHHKHIADFVYLVEDPNVPQGYNRLDTVPYVPPAPIYVPPAAPVPVPLATKVTIVTDVPYYNTSTNAQNAYKEAGRLPAGEYYQITKDFGMLNLSTDNTKDLQHWVNPRDNTMPEPAPVVLPVTKAPVIGDESGSWRGTYRAFPAKEVYLAIHNYLVSDIGGVRPAMRLNRYDPSISQVDGRVAVYGTFTGPDGVKYYRLRDPRDTEFTAYYGIPILDSNGMPILMKQPTIRVATPAPLPRKVSHKDTIHLLGSYLAEIEPKFIDILPKWYKSKNNKKG